MTGASSMRCSLLVVPLILTFGGAIVAQAPTYKLGRTPTEQELPVSVGPDGQGLPPGSGTASQGAAVYLAKCAKCHGATGSEGPGPMLVGTQPGARVVSGSMVDGTPFAPIIWNNINRMMPVDLRDQAIVYSVQGPSPRPCCLTADEVYGLTAYLLYRNGIIEEDDVMDRTSLSRVQMPARERYTPPPYLSSEWKPGMRKELVK